MCESDGQPDQTDRPIAIVESEADPASVHICDHLRDLADWETHRDPDRSSAEGGGTWYRTDGFELRSFADLHLDLSKPAAAFSTEPPLLVFASRHSGETGPLLTGHFTGNVGPAEYGGADATLAPACPNALAVLRAAFETHAPAGYDVGIECTHHGPTDVGCPSLFAELGSDEAQWNDSAGARAVAKAILDLRGVSAHRDHQVVGIGGGHYAPRFDRILTETPWAVGHVLADWGLESAENLEAVLSQAFSASGTDLAVLTGERADLSAAIESLGYRVVSETWLRTVGDRPRTLCDATERDLGPVADGIRFGAVRDESFSIASVPTALVDEAAGIDAEATLAAVADRTVAYETAEGGTRVGERVAIADEDALDRIVAALCDVLCRKYESVTVEADAVIVEEHAFDPERARELGVSDGPAFGRLTAGESVTVDGERIEPAQVHVERTRRFSL